MSNIASPDRTLVKFTEMLIRLSLFFAALVATGSSIRDVHREVDQIERPGLHLPLYHAKELSLQTSDTPLNYSDVLARDDGRVKFLNSRLSKKNLTKLDLPLTTSVVKGPKHLRDKKSVNVPLNPGESLGIANYFTRIGIGSPTTYHLVVVDTGSSFSWIQCEPCAVYCHSETGVPFNPASSGTYQNLSCATNQCSSLTEATLNSPMCSTSDVCIYTATYGDSSFSVGYLSKDSLSLGSESLSSFVFGCGQDNDGLFGKSAGLVGLAKNELSMLSQLSAKYGKAFSYCLPSSSPLGKTGGGGYLSIGTSSDSRYKFTPMVSDSRDSSLYFLKISTIMVSGKPLTIGSSAYNVSTIIDSGTTISRLATPVYSALRSALVKTISAKYPVAEAYSILDACFKGSFNAISTVVPPVQLVFAGGAELNLGPHNIIIEVDTGTTCLAFAGNSGRDIAIIGNTQQQTFDIAYDVGSSRIGFAAGGCH